MRNKATTIITTANTRKYLKGVKRKIEAKCVFCFLFYLK